LADSKRKEQEVSSRFKQLELGSRQLETELRSLKGRVFEEETRINDLESEKKKIENDLQRAMSQVSQLNKDRGDTQRLYDELKGKYDRYVA
jgi:chromosome segregation ATPase